MCERFLKTPWRFLSWKDVIEWISYEKLHLCEQGLSNLDLSTFLNISHFSPLTKIFLHKKLQYKLFSFSPDPPWPKFGTSPLCPYPLTNKLPRSTYKLTFFKATMTNF